MTPEERIENVAATTLENEVANIMRELVTERMMEMRTKLTKSFFMKLPTGVFLASNVYNAPRDPYFAETVSPLETREVQWRRIRNTGANQLMCSVFKDSGHYWEWSSKFWSKRGY
jgi:hypothetical protein